MEENGDKDDDGAQLLVNPTILRRDRGSSYGLGGDATRGAKVEDPGSF